MAREAKVILVRWEIEPLAKGGLVCRAYYEDMRPLYFADEYSVGLIEKVRAVETVSEFRFLNIPQDADKRSGVGPAPFSAGQSFFGL